MLRRITLWATAAAILIGVGLPGSSQQLSVSLVAGGDILLDRGVGRRIARLGPDHPFGGIASLLGAGDVAIANLECPISKHGRPVPKLFSFRAHPSAAAGLRRAGLTMLNLANNHTMDCGRAGISDTMAALRANGLAWCGAGRTAAAAELAEVVSVRGLRIAFVGFSDFVSEMGFPDPTKPTIARASAATVARSVAAARTRADVVVASFHWGVEFDSRPRDRQTLLAQIAADAGADLVIGHHPHVLQGMQWIRPKTRSGRATLVAYSMGNLVFDSLRMPSSRSALLRCTLTRAGVVRAEIVPLTLRDCRPVPASPTEREAVLARMAQLSGEMGLRMARGRIVSPVEVSTR